MGTTLAALVQDHEEGLRQLQERIGYAFRDLQLLQLSLVHSSFAFERLDDGRHNETLEFLGDAVLDLTVGAILFNRFPELREGKLTRLHAWLAGRGARLADFDSSFYSDSINDLPLLLAADRPVAVDPDEKLAAWAAEHGQPELRLR